MKPAAKDVEIFLWLLTAALFLSALGVHWVFMDIVPEDSRDSLVWRIWSPACAALLGAMVCRGVRK